MKKTIASLFVGVAGATMAMPAAAQENSPFTGLRVEALTGYDISRAGSSVDNDLNDEDDQSIEGLLVGVGAGYDFAVSGFVVGVEGELSTSHADTMIEDGDLENLGFGANLEAGRDLYAGARIGKIIGTNGLIYIKGGYTNARYNFDVTDGVSTVEADLDLDGWRVGAGAEYAVSRNTFIKLEYRYSNYNEGEFDFNDDDFFDEDTGEGDRFDADLDRHQVAVGVGIRF